MNIFYQINEGIWKKSERYKFEIGLNNPRALNKEEYQKRFTKCNFFWFGKFNE